MTKRETAQEIDDAAARWAARMDRAPLTADEERALEAWLAADVRRVGALAKARAVALHSERARALGPQFDAKAFAARLPSRWLGPAALGAMAAALVAVAVTGLLALRTPPEIYATRIGQVQVAPLADGSVVTLNTASEIAVEYSTAERKIELVAGEAVFDVAKNAARPFVVSAGDTQVRAVGTSFTVRRIQGRPVEVIVSEGVVEVTHGAAVQRVPANVRAVAEAKSVAVAAVAPSVIDRELAWRDGRIAFEGATLAEAARAFARYSETRIVIDDPEVANRTVTGLYVQTDPVGFARAVARAMNLEATVGEGEVRLSR